MISKDIKETAKIAEIFLNKLLTVRKSTRKNYSGALVVGLSGDLGAGKTAFTKAVAKRLGIKNKVFSPTYVLMKKYSLPLPRGSGPLNLLGARGSGFRFFFHIDAYRLENAKELLNLGWEEIVANKDHLVFIEWPENVAKAMPKHSKFIYISSNEKGHRNLKLK